MHTQPQHTQPQHTQPQHTQPLRTRPLSTREIGELFQEFYRERGHQRIEGSSLLSPPDDPVLYTTSGMHPLAPHLEGREHPQGQRLVNLQRCLRTTDIDEVGDRSHLTVFQMLGSWSLGEEPGGYTGEQSIRWGWEFLRDVLEVPPGHIRVTVFGGSEECDEDTSSRETWESLGVQVELQSGENWWSNGPTGVCGPDTEMFVWTGRGEPTGTPGSDEGWMEVWNHVLMRYRRGEDGRLTPLREPNVDTGMGLERISQVLSGTTTVFDCDVFEPWRELVGRQWGLSGTPERVVCDHLRSSVVVLGEGVRPSSTGRGYVVRRLIRRGLTRMWEHERGLHTDGLPPEIISHTLEQMGVRGDVGSIQRLLVEEEVRLGETWERGRKVVERQLRRGRIGEVELRMLHDTHGLPPEVVGEILSELGLSEREHSDVGTPPGESSGE